MDTLLNLMKSHRGVRNFSSKPVPRNILQKIIEAGSVAPAGAGIESRHIIVIEDAAIRHAVRTTCEAGEITWVESLPPSARKRILETPGFDTSLDYLEKAPILIVITTRPRDPEFPYAVESAFLSLGYMLVMVEGLGLGTITYTPSLIEDLADAELRRILGLPDGEAVQVMLPVGYPEQDPLMKPVRKELLNVYQDRFGQPIQF